MRFLTIALSGLIILFAFRKGNQTFERKERLSEYNFFKSKLSDLIPDESIIPYTVNTPLFSNYAEKLRFIKFPDQGMAHYNDTSAFTFPVGTILIKNFYYLNDFRHPNKGRRILETRLLVNEDNGWQAYPYVWNEDQTEAYYDPAGETIRITYVNQSGRKISSPYVIPNKNQCKGCHIKRDKMLPIGTTARQLNRDYNYSSGQMNQLQFWLSQGKINELPSPSSIPTLAVWDQPLSGTLNERARAYLDANCGHCHSPQGPANTSGLYLDIFEKDESHLGVNKAPVAAGRGAGNLQYDIVPGQPQNSILIFRMKTNDPAIAMPEIGREQVHEEAVALLQEWIRKNAYRTK
jgi:uncharacterized repeat protein (TIGR03806 family)